MTHQHLPGTIDGGGSGTFLRHGRAAALYTFIPMLDVLKREKRSSVKHIKHILTRQLTLTQNNNDRYVRSQTYQAHSGQTPSIEMGYMHTTHLQVTHPVFVFGRQAFLRTCSFFALRPSAFSVLFSLLSGSSFTADRILRVMSYQKTPFALVLSVQTSGPLGNP